MIIQYLLIFFLLFMLKETKKNYWKTKQKIKLRETKNNLYTPEHWNWPLIEQNNTWLLSIDCIVDLFVFKWYQLYCEIVKVNVVAVLF